jgi:hypothetical protein
MYTSSCSVEEAAIGQAFVPTGGRCTRKKDLDHPAASGRDTADTLGRCCG